MESNLDQNDIENVQFNSRRLDCFVSERFNLPCAHTQQILGSFGTGRLNLENSEWPHFEIFRYEDQLPFQVYPL